MNFMLDIETLDTKATAVILSVGIVPFTKDEVLAGQAAEFHLNVEEQMKQGRTIKFSTLTWWINQNQQASIPVFNAKRDQCIDETISGMNYYIFKRCEDYYNNENFYDREAIKIWSNGPTFDMKILENLYEMNNRSLPWHYRSPRCQRTIEALHGADVVRRPADGTQLHNAKYDAIFQAERVVDICKAKGLVI